jgi:hypothetical protein
MSNKSNQMLFQNCTLRDIDNLDIQLIINDQLFLEILLTEIRGTTISYATFKKRERVKLENTLTREIRKLKENDCYISKGLCIS